ncbi:MAG: leucyl/phenylalanyl-tRNA--protein transferase [Ignavibacteriales bacterium]|jgi:leucyl/phenylalanyl-tRNA--protein transferase|nr:MAG: leucyl/phenylalanyl-tRNA--protein transferase [Ignavibacteriaceae bacterium]MBW7874166.1 leucyl/phenylalanyl-tRNA--protein transferase [Ignavibacteria bacterium]MCZ2142941.1 leucyl/phenylalanyl-tRNA--protein transferase [Ignavibacteriales bacterium]OQY79226.1 MAG: leucyl/phenylalanyl-tRNA--protein transferase [Ignavibacteriales bacterium UTCHB3]MBV6444506.1 Leucyl/phenylalanyl-tRNA--protein transferase [Ignavibacteriaceae bacterium]
MSDLIKDDNFLTPGNMIKLYSMGAFPMAESRDTPEVNWYLPKIRAIIPLNAFNIPRSLKKEMQGRNFEVRVNENFDRVINSCAARFETWINRKLIKAYRNLYNLGYLHTLEVFENDELLGGLYGIVIGGAFMGESMFTVKSQGSKIALVELVKRLNDRGFVILDVQLMNPHLKMFGAVEIDEESYKKLLREALLTNASFL